MCIPELFFPLEYRPNHLLSRLFARAWIIKVCPSKFARFPHVYKTRSSEFKKNESQHFQMSREDWLLPPWIFPLSSSPFFWGFGLGKSRLPFCLCHSLGSMVVDSWGRLAELHLQRYKMQLLAELQLQSRGTSFCNRRREDEMLFL